MKRSPLRRDGDGARRFAESRSALSRASGLVRHTPIAPVSAKRRAEGPARRAAVAAAAERDGYTCQAAPLVASVDPKNADCWGPLVGHEPLKRSQGGNPNDVDDVLTVCVWHNQWVELEPALAKRVGLTVSPWERNDPTA